MKVGDKVKVVKVGYDEEDFFAVGDTGIIIDYGHKSSGFYVEFAPSPTVLDDGRWWVKSNHVEPYQECPSDVIDRYKQKILEERKESMQKENSSKADWMAEQYAKDFKKTAEVKHIRPKNYISTPNNYRVKYLRKRNRKPYGTFTSILLDGKLHVGWSLCNRKDNWNKAEGRAWANRRASILTKQTVPASIAEEFKQFIQREKRYYHVDKIENNYFVEMELAA